MWVICVENHRRYADAWVNEQQVVVDGGEVVNYRVDMKVTFVVN